MSTRIFSHPTRLRRVYCYGLSLAAALALLAMPTLARSATADPPSPIPSNSSLEQCANTVSACNWVTGNLGEHNSAYREGDVVPYRAIIPDLTSGTYRLQINYDVVAQSAHTLDYLATYNKTVTAADPCTDVAGCSTGSNTTTNLPDTGVAAGATCGGAHTLNPPFSPSQPTGHLTLFAPTAAGASFVAATSPASDQNVPSGMTRCSTTITVDFQVTGTGSYTLVLAWGGHIASAIDWGVGNSFTATNGSSGHMALVTPNKDVSINANAVAPQPDIATQVSDTTTGAGDTVTDTTTGAGDTVTDIATLSGAEAVVTGTVQFFYCKVTNLTDGCAQDDPTRTATGPLVPLSEGSATSAPIGSGLTPGNYCIGVQYHYDSNSFYSDTYSGSASNECFTVTSKAEPSVTTQLSTMTGPVTGTVPLGSTVSDTATISTSASSVTGSLSYRWYTTLAGCQADTDEWPSPPSHGTAAGGPFPVTGTGVQHVSSPVTFTSPDTIYWAAFYSGDTNNSPEPSDCTTEKLVVATQPTITTKLSDSTITVGQSVTDSATLTGATTDAAGNVDYRYYATQTGCQDDVSSFTGTFPSGGSDAGTKPVTNASVDPSGSVTFSQAGIYYWAAFYSGDANNAAAASDCATEVLTVNQADPAITTSLPTNMIATGQSVHDTAKLSGQTASVTGTVDYRYYSILDDCQDDTGSFVGTPTGGTDVGTVNVGTGGTVPDSSSVPITAAGTYYWAAFYSGDANNAAVASDCSTEVLVVTEHPEIVTTVTRNNDHLLVDTATLTGTGGTVTGTISFFLCAHASFSAGCPQGQGLAIPPPVTLANGSATSAPIESSLGEGIYCVGVLYHNDGHSPYLDTYSGNPNGECFKVVKPPPPPPSPSPSPTSAPPPPPGPRVIATHVSKSVIKPGGSLTDTAALSGPRGTVTGTVDFLLCSHTTSGCPQSSNGRTIQLGVLLVHGSATSARFGSHLRPGHYCVGVGYHSDEWSRYTDAYSGSPAHECFTVVKCKKPVTIRTRLSRHQIKVGGSVRDFAHLKGVTKRVHGVVRYRFYRTLHGCRADTSRWPARPRHGWGAGTVRVYGPIVHPSRWVRFPWAGTYYWAAFYSGSARYAPVASRCRTEVLRVRKPHKWVAT